MIFYRMAVIIKIYFYVWECCKSAKEILATISCLWCILNLFVLLPLHVAWFWHFLFVACVQHLWEYQTQKQYTIAWKRITNIIKMSAVSLHLSIDFTVQNITINSLCFVVYDTIKTELPALTSYKHTSILTNGLPR